MDDFPPDSAEEARRRPVKRLIAGGLFLFLLIALAVLWTQRRPIASDFIDRELASRGVQATYQVKRIGFRTQRLENLVIGDPRRPDLTARWVEVEVSLGFRQPRVEMIRARGVRIFGRIAGGKVSLGQVDRLLPPPTGAPFRFPDQDVDIADAAIALDSPAGRIALAIEGRGNLANGFRGKMAAVSHRLSTGDCRLERPNALWSVAINRLRPSLAGPIRAQSFTCGGGFALVAPELGLDATLTQRLDGWTGSTTVRAAEASLGRQALAGLSGLLSFDGNTRLTRGAMEIAAAGARVKDFRAGRTALRGRYAFSGQTSQISVLADASASRITGGGSAVAPILAALRSSDGTPIEPVGNALAASLARASTRFDAQGSLRLVNGRGWGAVRAERLSALSASGARLSIAGGDGITYYWPSGTARLNGDLALSGGGFPSARFSLSQPGTASPIRGTGRIAPMTAGGARLQLGEIRFTAAGGRSTRVDTVATMDGPIPDGRVEGLVMPVRARVAGGGFVVGEACTPLSFRTLQTASLRLGPTSFSLCPTGRALLWRAGGGRVQGGAQIRAPRFAGRLGGNPIGIVSDQLRFNLADRSFAGSNLAVRLGRPGWMSRLDLASLSGRFGPGGVSGNFAGASGRIGNVPLLLSNGSGDWGVVRGDLSVGGSLTVSDAVDPARFYPLRTDDFRLSLIDNRIRAGGNLHDPETGTLVSLVDIDHSLRTGEGRATLDVPGITFDEDFQPEALTRLTTGVIALVRGTVTGRGEVAWGRGGSSSTGTFSTQNMDLAAPFGPVEDLTTTVHFTDLLGLVSAPGQEAQVGLIRAGIDVPEGRIRYQLLPGLKVRVEAGRWPFSGGELILEETVLDFSRPSTKRLTFRVEGMDAALFVQRMEFSNITATGTFDGVIPMVFDQNGGRIVGGRLEAREPGGTLSYIGELSDRDLGTYGKLAFDALKSLRYGRLIIGIDGSLDGEFVTRIELDGIARQPNVTPASGGISGFVAGRALSELAKIPFEFNITIRGPFRALISTARSFEDPTNLIRLLLPTELEARIEDLTVQPEESENVP